MADSTNYTPRLQQKYKDVIQQELLASLNLNNVFEVPKISKVVINIGAGSESVSDSNSFEFLTRYFFKSPNGQNSISNHKLPFSLSSEVQDAIIFTKFKCGLT